VTDTQARGAVGSEIRPNERWWQEKAGWPWYAELQARKVSDDIYRKQEDFLREVFTRLARERSRTHGRPLRVLEFGCGFGRHLKYLHRIEGLEAHGCDASEAMLAVARTTLAGPTPELVDRLTLITPRGKLPYEDNAFDVVLTVAVLMHVAPDDLAGIVAEIQRVSAGRIIHVECEPAPLSYKWDDVHEGCWLHDLASFYLGPGTWKVRIDTDVLAPRLAVYDITSDKTSPGLQLVRAGRTYETPGEVTAASIEATLDSARCYVRRKQETIDDLKRRADESLRQRIAERERLEAEVADLLARNSRLEATLAGSRAFRFGQWLRNHRILYGVFAGAFALAAWLGRLIRRRPAPAEGVPGGEREADDGMQRLSEAPPEAEAPTPSDAASRPSRSEGY